MSTPPPYMPSQKPPSPPPTNQNNNDDDTTSTTVAGTAVATNTTMSMDNPMGGQRGDNYYNNNSNSYSKNVGKNFGRDGSSVKSMKSMKSSKSLRNGKRSRSRNGQNDRNKSSSSSSKRSGKESTRIKSKGSKKIKEEDDDDDNNNNDDENSDKKRKKERRRGKREKRNRVIKERGDDITRNCRVDTYQSQYNVKNVTTHNISSGTTIPIISQGTSHSGTSSSNGNNDSIHKESRYDSNQKITSNNASKSSKDSKSLLISSKSRRNDVDSNCDSHGQNIKNLNVNDDNIDIDDSNNNIILDESKYGSTINTSFKSLISPSKSSKSSKSRHDYKNNNNNNTRNNNNRINTNVVNSIHGAGTTIPELRKFHRKINTILLVLAFVISFRSILHPVKVLSAAVLVAKTKATQGTGGAGASSLSTTTSIAIVWPKSAIISLLLINITILLLSQAFLLYEYKHNILSYKSFLQYHFPNKFPLKFTNRNPNINSSREEEEEVCLKRKLRNLACFFWKSSIGRFIFFISLMFLELYASGHLGDWLLNIHNSKGELVGFVGTGESDGIGNSTMFEGSNHHQHWYYPWPFPWFSSATSASVTKHSSSSESLVNNTFPSLLPSPIISSSSSSHPIVSFIQTIINFFIPPPLLALAFLMNAIYVIRLRLLHSNIDDYDYNNDENNYDVIDVDNNNNKPNDWDNNNGNDNLLDRIKHKLSIPFGGGTTKNNKGTEKHDKQSRKGWWNHNDTTGDDNSNDFEDYHDEDGKLHNNNTARQYCKATNDRGSLSPPWTWSRGNNSSSGVANTGDGDIGGDDDDYDYDYGWETTKLVPPQKKQQRTGKVWEWCQGM